MLEIEVHIGTMLNDIGDSSRLDAAKKQLEYYIVEKKGQIPEGYGETASPPPKQDDKKPTDEAKKEGETESFTAKKKEGEGEKGEDGKEKPKETDAAAEARAKLLDPANLEPDAIAAKVEEAIKKGQKDTSVGAAEKAHAKVAAS